MPAKKPIIVITPTIISAVHAVWGSIASDLYTCAAECGEGDINNEQAVEACLDANRLKSFGYPAAEAEVDALVKEHGYAAVEKAIRKVCQLT